MGGVDTAPEMERMTDMRVYADQAATTSLSKTVLEAMLPWMTENFGNPSALYEEGRTARDAVETAREKIAHLLHAKAKEIYFPPAVRRQITGRCRWRQQPGHGSAKSILSYRQSSTMRC